MATKNVSELVPGDVIAIPSGGGRASRQMRVFNVRAQAHRTTRVVWLKPLNSAPGTSSIPRVFGVSKTVELADA